MTLQEIIADIHAFSEDLEAYERKYGGQVSSKGQLGMNPFLLLRSYEQEIFRVGMGCWRKKKS